MMKFCQLRNQELSSQNIGKDFVTSYNKNSGDNDPVYIAFNDISKQMIGQSIFVPLINRVGLLIFANFNGI